MPLIIAVVDSIQVISFLNDIIIVFAIFPYLLIIIPVIGLTAVILIYVIITSIYFVLISFISFESHVIKALVLLYFMLIIELSLPIQLSFVHEEVPIPAFFSFIVSFVLPIIRSSSFIITCFKNVGSYFFAIRVIVGVYFSSLAISVKLNLNLAIMSIFGLVD